MYAHGLKICCVASLHETTGPTNESKNRLHVVPQVSAYKLRSASVALLLCRPQIKHKAKRDLRVLNMEYGLVRKMNVEGHRRGCCDHICPMLLLQTLMKDLHMKQA